MSLTPKIYRSLDPGAPLLSGIAGAMATLLDAILVNGYGVGADAKSGLGWTREYSAANIRVYRNAPMAGTGCYLRVDDTGAITTKMRMFSAMSDIDNGSDPTPSFEMKAAGSPWEKSTVPNATPRHWMAIGTERFFYLFIDTGNLMAQYGYAATHPNYAGDIVSLVPGDRHHYVVSYKGTDSETSSTIGYGLRGAGGWGSDPSSSDSATCCFIGRRMTGTPGSVRGCVTAAAQTSSQGFGSNRYLPPYPYAANSGLLYAPVELLEAAFQPRGFLPGVYAPLHLRPFPEGAVVSDVAGLPSGANLLAKGYMLDSLNYVDTYASQVLFDTSSAW